MGNEKTHVKTHVEWTELKGKIKLKWDKFIESDIEGLKGNLPLIAEKLQKIYGYTKDKADQEFADFKKTLKFVSTR